MTLLKKSNIATKFLLILLLGAVLTPSATLSAQSPQSSRAKEAYFIDGLRYYQLGEFTKSQQNLEKVVALEPNNDAAHFYLANISLRNREEQKAELYIKKAIEIDSTNYWYRLRLAQLYLASERVELAINVYEDLKRLHPKKYDLYYDMVNIYMDQGEMDKALKSIDDIEAVAGKSEPTVLTRFNILQMQQKQEDAFKLLESNIPEVVSPRIYTILGDYNADRFRDSLALEKYDQALLLDKTYMPAFYGKAEIYRTLRDYENYFKYIYPFMASPIVKQEMKLEYFNQILSSPQFIQAFLPQIDTMVQKLYNANPQDTTTSYVASMYYAQTQRYEKSKEISKLTAERYPNNFSSNLQYLSLLYYLQDWELLITESQKASTKFTDNADLLQLQGIAKWQTKDLNGAIKAFEEILHVATKDSVSTVLALSTLGDLYNEQQNLKKSFSYYQKCLKIAPDYAPVLNNYAYFLSLEKKQLKKAYQMSKKTVDAEPDNPTYLDTFGWILYLMEKPLEAKGIFKHAMLYGGKESANILDHYAEVLFTLKEYDLAFIYWNQAKSTDPTLGLEEKINLRKTQIK